ncbi:hypothetical protein ACFVAJ_18665 [Agromyces sp. NPDC057679]|uniref:hypothetical protein n=1 Tax=Agromyces sp. NPDC057679 TaxID=3346207 RepID=UPI00366ECF93
MSGPQVTTVLAEDRMRELGFTDHRETHWYLCRRVGDATTLNVSISKANGSWTEDVLDEYFGQPAYYGRMRSPYREQVIAKVNAEIELLRDAGLDVRIDHRLYGVEEN